MKKKDEPDSIFGKGLKAREYILTEIKHMLYQASLQTNLDENSVITKLARSDMTNSQKLDMTLLLLFASHDTTAVSSCNAVYLLNKFKHDKRVIEPLLDELRVLEKGVSYEGLMECKYLHSWVREAFRMMPTVSQIPKMCRKHIELNGYEIPKGTNIGVNIAAQSVNENTFTNPLEFDPWRHISNGGVSLYEFTPFGGGSKMCLGWRLAELELKLMTYLFGTKCDFEIDNERLKKDETTPFNVYKVFGKFYKKN